MKKGVVFGFCILLMLVLISELVIAQNAGLEVDAGTTPDSAFYFIDEFFDNFGDALEVREEKVAEIKVMIEAGKIEEAREALENYMEQAEEFEREVAPEEREEALISAVAIRNALKKLEEEIPKEDKKEFVDDVLDKEGKILTSSEIAVKIKDLCEQLSDLDPMEYSVMCKTDKVKEDFSPKWKRKLDKKLTKEQEKEAKKFGKIMSKCFESSGRDCDCGEIPFVEFAKACSKAAPLATACDLGGDESACEELDNLQMPRLPDYLQDVFEDLEKDMMESKYDMHMPKECVDAGAKSPKECGKVMTMLHAPEECKEALLKAEPSSESEGRKICDEIMMKEHAPQCAEEGITDPEECKSFMDSFRGDQEEGMINFDCKKIENAEERLKCYDTASSQIESQKGIDDENYEGNCMTDSDWSDKKAECRGLYGEHAGDEPIYGDSGSGYECVIDAKCIDFGEGKESWEDIKKREKECADKCHDEGKAWDFSGGNCKCFGGDYEDDDGGDKQCDDCSSWCGGSPSRTDCVNGQCKCYYEDDDDDDSGDGGDDDGGTEGGTEGGSGGEEGTGEGSEGGTEGGTEGSSEEGSGDEEGTEGGTDSGSGTDSGTEGGTDSGSSSDGSEEGGSSDGGGSSGSGDSGGGSDSGSSNGGDSGGSSDSGGSDSGGSSGGSDSGGGGDSAGSATGEAILTGNAFLDYYSM